MKMVVITWKLVRHYLLNRSALQFLTNDRRFVIALRWWGILLYSLMFLLKKLSLYVFTLVFGNFRSFLFPTL